MGPHDFRFLCSLIGHAQSLQLKLSDEVNHDDLVALENLTELTRLEITNGSLFYLSPSLLSSKKLKRLVLKNNQIHSDFNQLTEKQDTLINHDQLKELEIHDIDNFNIPQTTCFPELRSLFLDGFELDSEGFLFVQNSPKIKELQIASCNNIQKFPQAHFDSLDELTIAYSSVSFENLKNFVKSVKNASNCEIKLSRNKNLVANQRLKINRIYDFSRQFFLNK